MSEQRYLYGPDDATDLANKVKEMLLIALEKEGLLTKTASEISTFYAVVLHDQGFLGRLWQKIFGEQKEHTWSISVVKKIFPVETKDVSK